MPAPGHDAQATESLRPMRSLLFIPADDEKKLGKGVATGADALILDLEDAVSAAAQGAPRARSPRSTSTRRGARARRPLLYVRINALDTDLWEDDLAGVAGARPDGILLPKARSGEDVHTLSIALNHAEERAGAPSGRDAHHRARRPRRRSRCCSCTPTSASSTRLEGLTWGAEDLSAVLGARTNREDDGRAWTSPYRLARDLCLFTAAAADAQPIDTVFVNFRDEEGLRQECARGRARRLHRQDGDPPQPGGGHQRGLHAERRRRSRCRRRSSSCSPTIPTPARWPSRPDGRPGARGPRRAHPGARQDGERDGSATSPGAAAATPPAHLARCGKRRRRRSGRGCGPRRRRCPNGRSIARWRPGRRSRRRDGATRPRRRPAARSALP